MRRPSFRSPVTLAVPLLACLAGVGCASSRPTARATDAASCAGTPTVVVHNGTLRSLEVVLSDGGVSVGRVLEVIDAGQQSQTITVRANGPHVIVRDQATRAYVDPRREPRIRFEYGCEQRSE